MVRPAHFGYNEQTAGNNVFQKNDFALSLTQIQNKATSEFDQLVFRLRKAGVNVFVVEDTHDPVKPDAVFPNNWISFHQDGTVITYPMFAPIRRFERREEILDDLRQQFQLNDWVHFEQFEAENKFLEGTGSMILDRVNKVVYACVSPRTDAGLVHELCRRISFEPILFKAVDNEGIDIYHTNVMMTVGEFFVVICLDTVVEGVQKEKLLEKFKVTNKEIIEISFDQMLAFAGNMLQVRNDVGDTFLVMSEQAFGSLTKDQISRMEKHTNILHSAIDTIEKYGGGSARCMMAEVFLPEKKEYF